MNLWVSTKFTGTDLKSSLGISFYCMATFIPVTTLVAVVPASKQAEMNEINQNWVIRYTFVYLILAISDIYKNKKYRIVQTSRKSFPYCVRSELVME